jgi:hypothetical protein
MCFHRSNAISFLILDETIFIIGLDWFRMLPKFRSLLGLTYDAYQHLWIQQMNRQVVIYIKKTLTNKSYTIWFPQQSLLLCSLNIHFIKGNW